MESEDLFQDGVDYSGEVICYSEPAPEAVIAEEEEVQDEGDDEEEENEHLEELENVDDDDEQDPNEDQDQDMVTDKNDDHEKPSTSNILCGNQKEISMTAEKIGDDKNSTKIDKEKTSENKLTQLPLSKIKNIIKLDPDLQLISSEALFAVTKATELFIDSLAKESFLFTRQAKKKIIQKRDVDLAISSVDSLMFLDGAMN